MAYVTGAYQHRLVRDTGGTTHNQVDGFRNNVTFVGDSGRNTFNVNGVQNRVDIHNLGGDDRVNLQGPGWTALPDANPHDGVVQYQNLITGSTATVRTDAGRNDAFVRARVNGAQPQACACPWDHMGHMSPAYAAGYADGMRGAGRFFDAWGGSPWGRMSFLGPLAWAPWLM